MSCAVGRGCVVTSYEMVLDETAPFAQSEQHGVGGKNAAAGFSDNPSATNTRHPVRWRDATAARVRACGCAWAGRYASRARRCSSRCGCGGVSCCPRSCAPPFAHRHNPSGCTQPARPARSSACAVCWAVIARGSGASLGLQAVGCVVLSPTRSCRCRSKRESHLAGVRVRGGRGEHRPPERGATASRACCRGVRDAAGGGDTGSLLPHAPAQPRGSSPAASPVPLRPHGRVQQLARCTPRTGGHAWGGVHVGSECTRAGWGPVGWPASWGPRGCVAFAHPSRLTWTLRANPQAEPTLVVYGVLLLHALAYPLTPPVRARECFETAAHYVVTGRLLIPSAAPTGNGHY